MFLLALVLCSSSPAYAQIDSVRVLLLADNPPERVSIRSARTSLGVHLRGRSRRTITIEGGDAVTVQPDGNNIRIDGSGIRASVRAGVFTNGSNHVLAVESRGTERRYQIGRAHV